MPKGEAAVFTLAVTSGAYSHTQTFSHRVGLEIASFENGFNGFEWENDPEHPWTLSTTEYYSGEYSL